MSYILQRNQSKAAFSHHALLSLFRKELIFALLLLATAVPAVQGQTYYVFYNENVGYIYDNGTDIPSVTSDLSTAIIWRASAAFGNTGINIRSYTRNDKYLRGGNNGTALSLGNTQSNWRLRSNVLNYNNGGGKGVLNQEKGKITGNTNVWLKGFIHVINNVYGGGLAGVVTGNTNVKLSD